MEMKMGREHLLALNEFMFGLPHLVKLYFISENNLFPI